MNRACSSLVVGALLAGASCKPSGPPVPSNLQEVGVFLPETKSAWGRASATLAAEAIAAHKNDFNATLQDAGGDAKVQSDQITAELGKNPLAILVSPVSDAVGPALKAARQKKVRVIVLDERVKGFDEDVYVGKNVKVVGGAMGALDFNKEIRDKPQVVVGNPTDRDEASILFGIVAVFKHFHKPTPRLLACDGGEASANRAALAYFKSNPTPAVISTLNGDEGLGVLAAAKEANNKPIRIVTVGEFNLKVLQAIQAGDIFDSITEPPGVAMALNEVIMNILQKEKVAKFYTTTVDQVLRENVNQHLPKSSS